MITTEGWRSLLLHQSEVCASSLLMRSAWFEIIDILLAGGATGKVCLILVSVNVSIDILSEIVIGRLG